MDDAGLDDSFCYTMIVYCVGVALVIVFDIYLCLRKRANHKASFTPVEQKEGEFAIVAIYILTFTLNVIQGKLQLSGRKGG